MESMQRSIGGTYFRSDGTFKVPKYIRVDGGTPLFCLYSIMNEFGQIVAWVMRFAIRVY